MVHMITTYLNILLPCAKQHRLDDCHVNITSLDLLDT